MKAYKKKKGIYGATIVTQKYRFGILTTPQNWGNGFEWWYSGIDQSKAAQQACNSTMPQKAKYKPVERLKAQTYTFLPLKPLKPLTGDFRGATINIWVTAQSDTEKTAAELQTVSI